MTPKQSSDYLSDTTRRRFIWGVGATGTAASLTGCIGDDEDDSDDTSDDDDSGSDEPGSISLTGVWTGGEEEDFRAVMEHVESETEMEIEYHPRDTETLLTGSLMDYESGVAPADIVVMPSPARVRDDGERGHLEPIGDIWDPDTYAAEPDSVTAGGEVYAAPFKMDLKPGFWYRTSFFDEHSLSEPETYDEFIDLLDEIQDIDGVDAPLASGNGVGWPLSDATEAYILRQDDGAQLQEDLIAGEASFTDDRLRTALEEIQATLDAGYWSELRDFGVQYEHFWENRLPLYFQGSFTPAFDAIQDPEDLGVFRLPGVEGMVASVNWFTIPTYGNNIEDAREALEHFVGPDGQQVWVERGGFIPSSEEVPEDAFDLQIMADLVGLASEVQIVPDLDDALGDPFQSEFWSQLTGLWSNPESDIDSILDSLNTSLEETHAD